VTFDVRRWFAGLCGRAADDEPARALSRRGIEALRAGEREAAIEHFAQALTLDDRCVSAIVSLGNMLLEDGAIDEAIVHYEAALRYDDRSALAHHNLGVALRRRGDRAGSVRHLRRATWLETTTWAGRRPRRRA
jgi:tetratricopeptide (TPR) repeat protein